MDLEEIGINTGNWVHSAQDREFSLAENYYPLGRPGVDGRTF